MILEKIIESLPESEKPRAHELMRQLAMTLATGLDVTQSCLETPIWDSPIWSSLDERSKKAFKSMYTLGMIEGFYCGLHQAKLAVLVKGAIHETV